MGRSFACIPGATVADAGGEESRLLRSLMHEPHRARRQNARKCQGRAVVSRWTAAFSCFTVSATLTSLVSMAMKS